jgi:hypothetical protein
MLINNKDFKENKDNNIKGKENKDNKMLYIYRKHKMQQFREYNYLYIF